MSVTAPVLLKVPVAEVLLQTSYPVTPLTAFQETVTEVAEETVVFTPVGFAGLGTALTTGLNFP